MIFDNRRRTDCALSKTDISEGNIFETGGALIEAVSKKQYKKQTHRAGRARLHRGARPDVFRA